MSERTDDVSTWTRRAVREAVDVDLESADGCLWVVVGLSVGDAIDAPGPADSEILFRDLRGGTTLEGIRRARLDAAIR